MKKIAFHTLGCKLNFSESSTLGRKFGENGYKLVHFSENADIYVINSCSVTRNAEKGCKDSIKKALKTNPDAHIAVIGCYSQINPEEISTLPGVGMVLGNADKFNLFEHIEKLGHRQEAESLTEVANNEPALFVPGYSSDDRTRTFFKIQDGCDYFCSYCTIPLARGRSRSNTIAETIKTAREIAQTNTREIVLSGVNIGDFGKKHGESLEDFLRELIKIDELERIRISSIEPNLLTNGIIELVAESKKLMPHFHIPLQAGSDEVLMAMGRRYNTEVFTDRVMKIKSLIPHACIAVDVIAGFPSETETMFLQSYDFLENLPVSYIHSFTYSERDNTRAMKIKSVVPYKIRAERSKQLQSLSGKKKEAFYLSQKGTYHKVLWEKDSVNGFMFGFTENYLKVKTQWNPSRVNTIESIQLNLYDKSGVYVFDQ